MTVEDGLNHLRDFLRIVFEVCILDYHDIAGRQPQPGLQCFRLTRIVFMTRVMNLRVSLCEIAAHEIRPVARAVVDDDHFEQLWQSEKLAHDNRQSISLVISWYHHRQAAFIMDWFLHM